MSYREPSVGRASTGNASASTLPSTAPRVFVPGAETSQPRQNDGSVSRSRRRAESPGEPDRRLCGTCAAKRRESEHIHYEKGKTSLQDPVYKS